MASTSNIIALKVETGVNSYITDTNYNGKNNRI